MSKHQGRDGNAKPKYSQDFQARHAEIHKGIKESDVIMVQDKAPPHHKRVLHGAPLLRVNPGETKKLNLILFSWSIDFSPEYRDFDYFIDLTKKIKGPTTSYDPALEYTYSEDFRSQYETIERAINDSDVIVLVNKEDGSEAVIFGVTLLESIAFSGDTKPKKVRLCKFPISFSSEYHDYAFFAAMVQVHKGYIDDGERI